MRIIKIVLAWTIVTPLLLEGLLRLFDPMGIAYLADIGSVLDTAQMDGAIYTLPAGKHEFRTFKMTILDDHSRRVPDTLTGANCTIVAIGDSGVMGHGVNDAQTWVNLLAREFSDVRFINAGVNGYNSHAVMYMQQRWLTQADGFIYRLDSNDTARELPSLDRTGMFAYVSAYVLYALEIKQAATPDNKQLPISFLIEMQVIDRVAPTLFLSSDVDLTAALTPYIPVTFIQDYTHHNSPADPHPNAAGHEELTRAMLPAVREAIASWCQ